MISKDYIYVHVMIIYWDLSFLNDWFVEHHESNSTASFKIHDTDYKHIMSVFSSFAIAHLILTRVTRRIPLVEQELFTRPIFRDVHVAVSLSLSAMFCFMLSFSLGPFSFDHCIACPSIYSVWLRLWITHLFEYHYTDWNQTAVCHLLVSISTNITAMKGKLVCNNCSQYKFEHMW